jgi:hypothetical protein
MTEIILYGGKGGVGKTTMAAASGVELANETVAATIHAGSLPPAAENFWGGKSPVGTLDRSAVRVPHERVREFCRLKADRADARTELDDMQSRIGELRDRCRTLEVVRDDPSPAPDRLSIPELEAEVRSAIDSKFGPARAVLERGTPDDVSTFVTDMADRYDSRAAALYAVTILDHAVAESDAFDRIQAEYDDTVSRLWDRYEASTAPDVTDVRTLRERGRFLEEHLSDRLSEYEDRIEQTDEGVLDLVPPSVDFLQSNRQELEARIERMREDRDALRTAQVNVRSEVRCQHRFDYLGATCAEISALLDQFIDLMSDLIVNRDSELHFRHR